MEEPNVLTYIRFLLNKKYRTTSAQPVVHPIQPTGSSAHYLKPNKNIHFSNSNLYYYFDTQDSSFEKINDTIIANLNLFKQDMFDYLNLTDDLYEINDDGSYLINTEKEISAESLDTIKEIYKKKFKEFEEESDDRPFIDNLLNHYENSFRSCLDQQNKEIVKIFNESIKTEEKTDSLSFNDYKRLGVEYFDITHKYLNSLTSDLNRKVDIKVELTRDNSHIKLDNMIIDIVKRMHNIYQEKSQSIINNLYHIQSVNKTLTSFQGNYLNTVNNYFSYLNFAYLSNDWAHSQFLLLEKILKDQYSGHLSLYHSLINKYGYVNKRRALTLCDEINSISSTAFASYQKNRQSSFKDILAYTIADVILSLKYQQKFRHDIENNNLKDLIKHLNEYESHAVANYHFDSVVMLNLYAITSLLNDKIYSDYLQNTDFLKL